MGAPCLCRTISPLQYGLSSAVLDTTVFATDSLRSFPRGRSDYEGLFPVYGTGLRKGCHLIHTCVHRRQVNGAESNQDELFEPTITGRTRLLPRSNLQRWSNRLCCRGRSRSSDWLLTASADEAGHYFNADWAACPSKLTQKLHLSSLTDFIVNFQAASADHAVFCTTFRAP